MKIIFWLVAILLFSLSQFFILPWLKAVRIKAVISLAMAFMVFGLYLQWGSSKHLDDYYSSQGISLRTKHEELRQLLTEFRKEEFRLRIRLEKNSNDLEAEWRLSDLLAIKALYNQDYQLAIKYWEIAIAKIPKPAGTPDEVRIRTMINLMRQTIP